MTNDLGTATLVLCVPGGQQQKMQLAVNFDSLDQPEFVDAVERKYGLEQITKDGKGGMSLHATYTNAQRETLVEDVADLFAETYREKY